MTGFLVYEKKSHFHYWIYSCVDGIYEKKYFFFFKYQQRNQTIYIEIIIKTKHFFFFQLLSSSFRFIHYANFTFAVLYTKPFYHCKEIHVWRSCSIVANNIYSLIFAFSSAAKYIYTNNMIVNFTFLQNFGIYEARIKNYRFISKDNQSILCVY